ncbi:protein of unknown function [Streptomyces sp. yr375]|uniref:DUF397 domain-containing protein n=1 Tax=Streptomyces sp. yr375 TaxID=1761906 RepID=UPI0008D52C70|nr:DUF397 domain-containing protein [Streptomyces sp. yr375]SEQ30308.1 protein of unknown function [Streptomyces sp. yr375]
MSQSIIADASTIDVSWQKSSASGHNSDCVELAPYQDVIAVRDSKVPHGPAILYPRTGITALIAGIKAGEFGRFTHDR